MSYPIEYIPDEDFLFHWIHENRWQEQVDVPTNSKYLEEGKFPPNLFRYTDDNCLSADWARHSTAAESRSRVPNPCKNYGVVEFQAGSVRSHSLSVDHDPIYPENRAHSLVSGNEGEMRKALSRKARWVPEFKLSYDQEEV